MSHAGFKSLADKKRDNPDAFVFDTSAPVADTVHEAAEVGSGAQVSLSVMLGGNGLPIERKGIQFWPHSPELGSLDALGAVAEGTSGLKRGAALIQLASFFLYVIDADGTERDATPKEVGKCFSIQDATLLSDLFTQYCGMKMVPVEAGNA